MLDYWEYTTVEGDWTGAVKVENTIENDKTQITVTIEEDRWYRAVFKPWEIIMPGDAVINGIDTQLSSLPAKGIILTFKQTGEDTLRSGTPAGMSLQFGWPSIVPVSEVTGLLIKIYAGDFHAGETPDAPLCEYMVPALGGSGDSIGAYVISATVYIERLPNAEGVTVEITRPNGAAARKYYALPIVRDLLEELRSKTLSDLEEYYLDGERFGTNPPGAEAPPDSVYKSFADVRYLLRDAYAGAREAILYDAATGDEISAAYESAIERFNQIIGLQAAIDEGDGDAYKAIPGVVKAAVMIGLRPSFSYAPTGHTLDDRYVVGGEKAWTLLVLESALESTSPGEWVVGCGSLDPNAYITSISSGGGDGKSVGGSPNGNIIYAVNASFPNTGLSSFGISDRSVMRIGNAGAGYSFPTIYGETDDLIWALAALREIYTDAELEQSEAYKSALSLISDWTTPVTKTVAAYNALFVAFPDDAEAMRRYDLSEAVLDVMALINAIGNVTPESEDAIAAAREAYGELSDENKALVPNYVTLTDAEAAFALLVAERPEYEAALSEVVRELGKLGLTVGSQGGEWALLAAVRSGAAVTGSTFTNGYLSSLNKLLNDGGLDNITTTNYTDFARITLALSSLGIDASNYSVAGETYDIAGQLTNFGRVAGQGVNGPAYALIALDSKPYIPENTAIRNQYVEYILGEEVNGGGWALSGDKADPDITAAVLQALARYRDNAAVGAAVTRGLAALKMLQDKTYGGFYSWGQYNSESAAQTVVALTALGLDPTGAEWTVGTSNNPLTALLAFYDAQNRGFRHALNGGADQMATEQAAYALAAYGRFMEGQNALYDMSDAFGGPAAGVNKNELDAAISLAQSLNETDYARETWGALETALASALDVRGDADAEQSDVDAAKSALYFAVADLLTAERYDVGAGRDILDAVLYAIEYRLITSGTVSFQRHIYYTAESWKYLEDANGAAKDVAPEAEREDADAAAQTLLDAMIGLELSPVYDRTLLNATLLANKNNLTESEYTAQSWSNYSGALTAAVEANQSDGKTQESVDIAAKTLILAIGDLTRGADENYAAVVSILQEIKRLVKENPIGDQGFSEESLAELETAVDKASLVSALRELTVNPPVLNTFLLEAARNAAWYLAQEPDMYTEETLATLSLASADSAIKILQNLYTEQSEVDADAAAILNAIKSLSRRERVLSADKTLLGLFITHAEL
ncbi:MAG: hypothetical protein LBD92_01170, partial [Oscillospiraceae bacterium]|nr:hypothetical protein [Oscillospiraceae bacterium]